MDVKAVAYILISGAIIMIVNVY